MNDLIKHVEEVAQALRQFRYEVVGDGGVLFPAQHVVARGLYSHRVNKGPWSHDPNLVPDEGLNYLLDQLLGGGAAAPCYLSLYANAISPAANWTAANYNANAVEIISATDGYSEATRQAWTTTAAVTKTKDNYASPAVFTIVATGPLSVNGVGLHTVSTKGAGTGKLVSATRFGSTRTFANTDVFDVKYQLALTSS